MKQYRNNNELLLEFLKEWDLTEWKRVGKLAMSGYLSTKNKNYSFRNNSVELFKLILANIRKIRKMNELSFEIFSKTCPNHLKKSDWSRFASEIVTACLAHVKMSLGEGDFEIHSGLEMQRYFQNNRMWLNYDYMKEQNQEIVLKGTIFGSLEGVWKRMMCDLELSDIREKEKRILLKETIQEWKDGTEQSYQENMLMIYCAELGFSNYLKVDVDSIDNYKLDDFLNQIAPYTQVELYRIAYLLRKEHSDALFYQLKEMLDGLLERESRFDNNYFAPLYVVLLSHCIYKAQLGEEVDKFRAFYISICKKMLKKNLLLEQGRMDKRHFRNIVTSYIKLGNVKEAIGFIEEHQEYLQGEKNNPFIRYCFAFKHYEAGNYSDAYKVLSTVRKNIEMNDFIKLQVKLLFLFSALDISKAGVVFKKEIRNSREMIERKKGISERYIEAWSNTVDYLEKLYKIPRHEQSEEFPKIKKELNNENHIKHKDWFNNFIDKKMEKHHIDAPPC